MLPSDIPSDAIEHKVGDTDCYVNIHSESDSDADRHSHFHTIEHVNCIKHCDAIVNCGPYTDEHEHPHPNCDVVSDNYKYKLTD